MHAAVEKLKELTSGTQGKWNLIYFFPAKSFRDCKSKLSMLEADLYYFKVLSQAK